MNWRACWRRESDELEQRGVVDMQITVLAAAAAALAAIFRLRPAPARLVYWQALLALCLLLPLVQPWRQETVVLPSEPPVVVSTGVQGTVPVAPRGRTFTWTDAALAVLAAGVLLRAGWFGLGLLRLSRYRRGARILHPLPAPVAEACRRIGVYPEIGISSEVSGPVTFGFRDPVILLPAHFPELEANVQSVVASHELLHVRRRDWLFTAIEELVRAVFWFHPAIWWTLGQIQLAREQSVDRAVVKLSETRERYVEALLALSGARSQLDLAPAPLFLRRHHLTARVAAILKEADMTKRRLWGTLAVCAGGVMMAGWLVCVRLPLQAAPQYIQDAPGVTVTGADKMLHRNPVPYPSEARDKKIEGTLVLDVVVGADGNVLEATVLSGPEELRAGALKSVLGWHFRPEAAGRQQVIVEFKAAPAGVQGGVVGGVPRGVVGGVVGGVPGGTGGQVMEEANREQMDVPRPLERLFIRGLSKAAEAELTARINLHTGQIVDNTILEQVRRIVGEFDSNLIVSPALFGKRVDDGPIPAPKLAISIFPGRGGVRPEHAPAPGETTPELSGVPRKLNRIVIVGISPEAAEELRRRLPFKEGDLLDGTARQRMREAIKAFDPRLDIVGQGTASRRPEGANALPDVVYETVHIGLPGTGLSGFMIAPPPRPGQEPANVPRGLKRIEVQGLAPEAVEELRRRLPVKEGQVLSAEDFPRIEAAVKAFDPHLSMVHMALPPDNSSAIIFIRPSPLILPMGQEASSLTPDFPPTPGVQRIRVGGNVQQNKLKYQVRPEYPAVAKEARLQGTVRLSALIDPEGNMKSLKVIDGHPLLVPAAMESVKEWQYQTTLLNGVPVEVVTQIHVNFTLSN